MAQELDDGEFWLPSEFLTDDDLLMDFKTDHSKAKRSHDFSSVFSNSFGLSSELSSPGESVMGSTETESDEDEFLSGLTRKMAHSTLQRANYSADFTAKGLKLSGSPQSTLCGFKPGSSQTSPNCSSRASSPPGANDAIGWDMLYAVAGEVARMRKTDDTTQFQSTKHITPPPKPTFNAAPAQNIKPSTSFYQNHAQMDAQLAYLQFLATHKMKQQQMIRNGVWGHGKIDYQFQNGKMNREVGRNQGLSMAAWPTLQQSQQQKAGSSVKPIFHGETGPKKERTGTGVFLPRINGTNSHETRKKPGCSTVLLPDKVVQALNMNLNSIDAQPHLRCNRSFTPEYDAGLEQRNIVLMSHQRGSHLRQPVLNQELMLPQEWTY